MLNIVRAECPACGCVEAKPVLYINLPRERTRRAHIEAALAQAGLTDIERVEAIDGAAHGLGGRRMSAGEAGCYASHIRAWKRIISRDIPYALVVEDDALVPPGLCTFLARLLPSLPQSWDIVYLYSAETRAKRPLTQIGDRQLVRYSRVPSGAVGYLLSQQGARKLLARGMGSWPVDTEMRCTWKYGLDVYGIEPAVIRHGPGFTSSLAGKRSRSRRGLTLSPLRSPVSMLWNIRKLGLGWWLWCLVLNTRRRLLPVGARQGVTVNPAG